MNKKIAQSTIWHSICFNQTLLKNFSENILIGLSLFLIFNILYESLVLCQIVEKFEISDIVSNIYFVSNQELSYLYIKKGNDHLTENQLIEIVFFQLIESFN